MPVDVNKITESRKAARESTTLEHRPAIALEQVADTLEAIRAEFVLLNSSIGTLIRAVSK